MTPRARKPLGGRGTNQYVVRGQSVDNSREESDSIRSFGKFSRPPRSSVSVESSTEELKSALSQLRDAIHRGDSEATARAERDVMDNSAPAYASVLIEHEKGGGTDRSQDISDHAQGEYRASPEDLEDSMKGEHPETAHMASLVMTAQSDPNRSRSSSRIVQERNRLNSSRLSHIGL